MNHMGNAASPKEKSRGEMRQKGIRRVKRTWAITAGREDGGRGKEAKQCGWSLEAENDS